MRSLNLDPPSLSPSPSKFVLVVGGYGLVGRDRRDFFLSDFSPADVVSIFRAEFIMYVVVFYSNISDWVCGVTSTTH